MGCKDCWRFAAIGALFGGFFRVEVVQRGRDEMLLIRNVGHMGSPESTT
jgi:hypothetical protein